MPECGCATAKNTNKQKICALIQFRSHKIDQNVGMPVCGLFAWSEHALTHKRTWPYDTIKFIRMALVTSGTLRQFGKLEQPHVCHIRSANFAPYTSHIY